MSTRGKESKCTMISVNIICVLLDGHDLIVEIEPVGDPLEAGDLLVLSLHHPTHLLHLSSEIMQALSHSCYTDLWLTWDLSRPSPGWVPGPGGSGARGWSPRHWSRAAAARTGCSGTWWCLGPRYKDGCDWQQASPAQLLGINHNLYNSPPPLPYLQTQNYLNWKW